MRKRDHLLYGPRGNINGELQRALIRTVGGPSAKSDARRHPFSGPNNAVCIYSNAFRFYREIR